jgi:DNA mismatch endonuclease (patch repair protein)
MQGNRRRDTGPEIALRRALRAEGLVGYRVDRRVAGARPDVCWPGRKVAVFVNGCFWHDCPRHGSRPKTNREYWLRKFVRNRNRDRRQTRALRRAGWHVVHVWEHESPELAARRVRRILEGSATAA